MEYAQALYEVSKLEQSPEWAMSLLERAHAGGVVDAATRISDNYAEGRGVPKDLQKAKR